MPWSDGTLFDSRTLLSVFAHGPVQVVIHRVTAHYYPQVPRPEIGRIPKSLTCQDWNSLSTSPM